MLEKLINKYPIIEKMTKEEEIVWVNPNCDNKISTNITLSEIEDVSERLNRFAPYIKKVFKETSKSGGIIESPLKEISQMKAYMEEIAGESLKGRLMLKCDNNLPISGSIKARGGIYEVLWFAEKVAMENGMLKKEDDYACLENDKFKELFSKYSIVVGSTGNLGLSIGVMGAKLGFRVVVHMSIDASQWKKDLLRERGAEVVEHTGNYSEAVAVGRKQAQEDENSHFVDDENSRVLFLGYAVTGLRMKEQLDSQGIVVDKNHPLFVYLPCGVGSAPGGVAYGLKHMYGENVHCFFAEPVKAPCVFLGVLTGLHDEISVHDIGLDGKTIADGLAVSRASGLVGSLMGNLIDGFFTVEDSKMEHLVGKLYSKESIFVEPSAASGFPGYSALQLNKEYIKKFSNEAMENSTHIAWATGGGMVPQDVREKYI
ncbi:MAG: D-serine ammonia-lyase [Defluviitaleaceae bacterium]|nr:D-serine ammonia-lyase [Defluviitaleaceae bacterium]